MSDQPEEVVAVVAESGDAGVVPPPEEKEVIPEEVEAKVAEEAEEAPAGETNGSGDQPKANGVPVEEKNGTKDSPVKGEDLKRKSLDPIHDGLGEIVDPEKKAKVDEKPEEAAEETNGDGAPIAAN